MQGKIINTTFADDYKTLCQLLDASTLRDCLAGQTVPILIKPNLVEALEPPITTPVALVEHLVTYLQENYPSLDLIVGEGTGSIEYDTFHCFETLGYTEMASRKKVELIDLNTEPVVRLENIKCHRWPEIFLPRIALEAFILSVPVLKAHSLADVTLTMKNMMGFAPPTHYRDGNSWGKSAFHKNIHEAIYDLNRYRKPDFTLLDASVGMAQAHLWGPTCEPPVCKLAVSDDPVAIDSYGTALLGRNWESIQHIHLSHTNLGLATPLDVTEV